MWVKCRGYIVALVVGFIVAFLMSKCAVSDGDRATIKTDDKTVEVRLVTKIDTVFIPHNVYHTDSVKITLIKSDTIFKDGGKEVAMIPAIKRTYRDSTKVDDSVYVGYKAQVTGTLDKMDVSYSNKKSIMVIHKTDSVFTNTTITKRPGGLFIGVDGGYNTITPKLEYVKDNNAFSAGYNVINRSPQIGYSRRLF